MDDLEALVGTCTLMNGDSASPLELDGESAGNLVDWGRARSTAGENA